MMHLLAQGGGSGPGSWFNPNYIRLIVFVVIVCFSLLATLIKKINERQAKREAELAKLRRQDQMLRTGRAEDGSVVRAPVGGPGTFSVPPSPDDARRKLQELAERRRRELAEMMRRAQEGQSAPPRSASQQIRPPTEAPPRRVPPVIRPIAAPSPMRSAPPRPAGQNVFAPARVSSEREIRRQRESEANKKAAREAAARRKGQEQERRRVEAISPMPASTQAPARTPDATVAAYVQTAQTRTGTQASATARVGSAIARGSGTGAAADWRRAVVLSELLGTPVGQR